MKPPKPECLILGNGPSLLGRDWKALPRERVYVFGVNQSWRIFPRADAHISVDHDQWTIPECKPYYEEMAKKGTLFYLTGGEPEKYRGARKLDRHDALTFSRRPFQKRHRGAHIPRPALEKDGGVALKVGHEAGGSSAYIALQIAAAMGFERFWFVGLDLTGGKFTGKPSNSEKHDRLWRHVPKDIIERTRVIAPSATQVFQVVQWPWGAAC